MVGKCALPWHPLVADSVQAYPGIAVRHAPPFSATFPSPAFRNNNKKCHPPHPTLTPQLGRSTTPVKALTESGRVEVVAGAVKLIPVVRDRIQRLLAAPGTRPWSTEAAALPSTVPLVLSDPAMLEAVPDDAAPATLAIARVRRASVAALAAPSRLSIERRASLKWERILAFLVGEPGAAAPPPDVLRFLLASGLLVPLSASGRRRFHAQVAEAALDRPPTQEESRAADGDVDEGATSGSAGAAAGVAAESADEAALRRVLRQGQAHLSPRGYRFLLADTEQQLWTVVRHYVSSRAPRADAVSSGASGGDGGGASAGAVVRLLMRLGHCSPGDAVPLAALSPAERRVLADLEALGVVVMDGAAASAQRAKDAAVKEAELVAAERLGATRAEVPTASTSSSSSSSSSGSTGGSTGARDMVTVAATAEARRLAEGLTTQLAALAGVAADRFYVSSLASALLSSTKSSQASAASLAAEDTVEGAAARAHAGSQGGAEGGRAKLTSQGWSGGLEGRAFSRSRAQALVAQAQGASAAAAEAMGSRGVAPMDGLRLEIFAERNFRLYAQTARAVHASLLGERVAGAR